VKNNQQTVVNSSKHLWPSLQKNYYACWEQCDLYSLYWWPLVLVTELNRKKLEKLTFTIPKNDFRPKSYNRRLSPNVVVAVLDWLFVRKLRILRVIHLIHSFMSTFTFIRHKAETQQKDTCTLHTHTRTHCKNSKIH